MVHRRWWAVLLGVVWLSAAAESVYKTFPCKSGPTSGIVVQNFAITIDGQRVTAHSALIPNACNHFHIYPPRGGCPGAINTSTTARGQRCGFATNGNFFDTSDGGCLGYIISDGTTVANSFQFDAFFGIAKGAFVVGQLNDSDIRALQPQQLISAKPWMVRDGKNTQTPGGEIAPRTAIGYNSKGELILLVVDGAEVQDIGFTLYQLGELMLRLGIVEGINLDGGGSSVAYYNGKVISKPTCDDDIHHICERPVTSITCIR